MPGGNSQGVKLPRLAPTWHAMGWGRTELQPQPGRTAELRDDEDGTIVKNTDSLALPWNSKSDPPEGGLYVWTLTRPRPNVAGGS